MNPNMRELDQVAEIHLFPYSHHDYAWTNSREWHIKRYLLIFAEVLDLMKEDAEFTFQVDNVLHSLLPFLRYCPERVEELKARVREGRFHFASGGMALARPTCVGEETYIRNMAAGKKFFAEFFGVADLEFFANFDTAVGHSQMPQLLRLGGHKYYRFYRPEEALDARGVPKQFWWQGLDGSTVLVSRGGYFGFHDGKFTNMDYETEWERIKEIFREQELKDRLLLLPTDLLMLYYGSDDTRPLHNLADEPLRIREFVREWNRREPSVMKFSTPKSYFALLEQKAAPTVEGIIDPCELIYLSTYKGDNSFWKKRTSVDRLIVKAESFAAYAAMLGFDYPAAELARLWDDLFEFAGHAIEFIFEKDHDELYAVARSAETQARLLIRNVCDRLAGIGGKAAGLQYVAFNSLNWRRKELVRLHITGAFGVGGFEIADGRGNTLDYQIIKAYTGEKPYVGSSCSEVDVAVLVDVPAMGCATLNIVDTGRKPEEQAAAEAGAGTAVKAGDEPEPEPAAGAGAKIVADAETETAAKVVTEKAAAAGAEPELAGGHVAVGRPLPNSREPLVVDNGVLRVTFRDGAIADIRDRRAGRSIAAAAGGSPFHGIRFIATRAVPHWDPSWEAVEESPLVPETWELLESGPLVWRYRVTGRAGGEHIRQDLVLVAGESAVRFEVVLRCTGTEGYFAADFAADPDTPITADIPFGVEERKLAGEAYGTLGRGNPGQFYGKTWAAFRKSGLPVAIVAESTYIFYHHDTERNTIAHTLHRCLPLHNKLGWVRNIHPSMEGTGEHRFAFSLYVGEEDGRFVELAKLAKSRAYPLEIAPVMNAAARSGPDLNFSFLAVNADHVIVSAFYREGEDYLLRLYETEGKSAALEVALPVVVRQAEKVDFLGQPAAGEVRVSAEGGRGVIHADVTPWQIVTLRFRTDGLGAVDSAIAGSLSGRTMQ